MWEVNLRVLGLHVVHELLQAIEERHHCEVKAAIVKEPPKVQIARAVQLVCRLVARGLLYAGERAHGHKPVAKNIHDLKFSQV